uniref:Uncharacterized protein n=1 Tax=Plectus sambesii TaxID=2011161 RepID=A0A914X3S0_9BILA
MTTWPAHASMIRNAPMPTRVCRREFTCAARGQLHQNDRRRSTARAHTHLRHPKYTAISSVLHSALLTFPPKQASNIQRRRRRKNNAGAPNGRQHPTGDNRHANDACTRRGQFLSCSEVVVIAV